MLSRAEHENFYGARLHRSEMNESSMQGFFFFPQITTDYLEL